MDTTQNGSAVSKQAKRIITDYLEKYFELVNSYDAIKHSPVTEIERQKEEYAEKQQVVDQFNKAAGIIGGAMIFADNSKSTSVMLQEKQIDTPFPGYFHITWLPEKNDKERDTKKMEEIIKKKDLIQAILHSSSVNKNFKSKNILHYPKYFLNLPPEIWECAFSRSDFEQKIINSQNVNYLFCLVEEILFFNYIWRYLIRHGRIHGLDYVLDLSALKSNDNESGEIKNILDINFWHNFSALPEYELRLTLDKLSEDPKWINVSKIFEDYFGKGPLSYSNEIFNTQVEWKHLGLPYKTDDWKIKEKTLINLRQLLRFVKEICNREDIISKCKEEYSTVEEAFKEIDSWLICDSSEEHKDNVKKHYEQAYTYLSYKDKFQEIHFAIVKIGLTLLADTIRNKGRKQWVADLLPNKTFSIGNFLSALHGRSRFPILTSYFLTYLEGNSTVYDYFIFPILVSNIYTIDSTNFTSSIGNTIQQNKAVLMLAFIEPIWTNNAFRKEGSFLKEETEDTVKGFKLNQLFYSKVARKVMDEGFYGTYFRKAEWREIFSQLRHSQMHYLNAIHKFTDVYQLEPEARLVLIHYRELLKGFLVISENLGDLESYVESLGDPIEIDLVSELNFCIDTILILLSNKELAKNSFQLNEESEYVRKGSKLFNGNYKKVTDLKVKSYLSLVQLLFKDILVNAVEHCRQSDPIINVDIKIQKNQIVLRVSNNSTITSAEYEALKDPSLLKGKYGFKIMKAISKALNWKLILPVTYDKIKETETFFVEFHIPVS